MKVKQFDIRREDNRRLAIVASNIVEYPGANDSIANPAEIAGIIEYAFHASELPEEHVWIVALNCKLKLIGIFEVSHGDDCGSITNIRGVMQRLLLCGASSFAMVHNHPSGESDPSLEDIETTKKVKAAASLMEIKLVDHLIIGDNVFSFYEKGLINNGG